MIDTEKGIELLETIADVCNAARELGIDITKFADDAARSVLAAVHKEHRDDFEKIIGALKNPATDLVQ